MGEAEGNGVVWVEKSEFGLGTIELDVRGRDLPGQSFVGIAFHRQDDTTYEGVYLRPFNFRNADVARRQNAVQYISLPDYDWPRLRKEFPSEFENPVDESVVPTDWVPLRVVVAEKTVQVFVGGAATAALEVRRLGTHNGGAVGLWAGNGSDGAFANLKIDAGEVARYDYRWPCLCGFGAAAGGFALSPSRNRRVSSSSRNSAGLFGFSASIRAMSSGVSDGMRRMKCTRAQLSRSPSGVPVPHAGMPVRRMPFSMIAKSSPSESACVRAARMSGAGG